MLQELDESLAALDPAAAAGVTALSACTARGI